MLCYILPGYRYDANSHSSDQVNSSNGNPLRFIRNPGHLAPGLLGGGDMVPGIIVRFEKGKNTNTFNHLMSRMAVMRHIIINLYDF